jgi:chromosome segregation and condensation protein ScpB
MELASIIETREDIVKELDDMKQSMHRVLTILDNFSTKFKLAIAETRATCFEGLFKKEPKKGNDSN